MADLFNSAYLPIILSIRKCTPFLHFSFPEQDEYLAEYRAAYANNLALPFRGQYLGQMTLHEESHGTGSKFSRSGFWTVFSTPSYYPRSINKQHKVARIY